jgi:hypothetical protein
MKPPYLRGKYTPHGINATIEGLEVQKANFEISMLEREID